MNDKYYIRSIKLLRVLSKLESDIRDNYQNGNICQRALANIAGLQCDLFTSYIVLLGEDEDGPIVGRSVILRSILENQGSLLHIKDNERRSDSFLGYVEKIEQQVNDMFTGNRAIDEDMNWSSSTISQRVLLIDKSTPRLYNMLSNFTHGNNVQYFINTPELTEAYTKAIDSYFIGIFIGFLAEIGIGLDMKDTNKQLIFDVIDSVS